MESGHRTNYRAELGLMTAAVFLVLATASAMGQAVSPESRATVETLPITNASKPKDTGEKSEIDLLKAQLAAQQEELSALRKALEEQTRLIERVVQRNASSVTTPASVTVDSATSDAKQVDGSAAAPLATSESSTTDPTVRKPQAIAEPDKGPLTIKIGSAYITPFGSFDLTAFYRSKNIGSGVGTSFGAIPFSNTVNGHLNEIRYTAQKTRLGFRLDAKVGEVDVLGYLETDFLGFSPSNIAINSNSDTQRLRLAWASLRKNKFEIVAGQSWSMLTPNRKGLSPLPSDVFLTQGLDSNYHAGLTWSRNPQFRLIYHATKTITLGWSVEASEQYAGGSGGSGAITLPSGLAASYASQLNTGSSTFNVPNPHQDSVFKIAFDPKIGKRAVHFEVAGLLSRFSFFNPLSEQKFSAVGGGAAVNGNIELFKNFRLFGNTFFNKGGGRWIFGQGPDLIIRGDGSPELVRSASTIDGIEYQVTPKTMIYAYYGGAYFERAVAIDPANGNPVGFGYTGSPLNHNRSIQQGTFGVNYTFWSNPNYGSSAFLSQYSYLVRHPWHVPPGQPGSANVNMVYLTLRYTLPGAPPKLNK